MAKGIKTGGRVAGTPNKTPFDAFVAAHKYSCNPFEILCMAALGDMPCNVCLGKGRTKYKIDGEIHERTCESCYGSLKEHISPETRVKAASELAQYLAAKRKQIDNISSDGSMRPVWTVQIAAVIEQPKTASGGSNAHSRLSGTNEHHPRVLDVPSDDDVQ